MRLYIICKMMKWTHLPDAGGLYDQHPKLLDDFMTVASAEAKVEKRKEAKREQERRKTAGKGASGRGRRRR